MPEVGSLRVNLGLDSANFTKNIQDINRRLKALDTDFKAASAGANGFDESLDGLKTGSANLSQALTLHQNKVSELGKKYEELAASKGKDSKEAENALIRYNKAVAAMKKTEAALEDVNSKIEEQSNKWNQLSKKVNDASEKISQAGERLKGVGQTLSTSLTLPLATFGAAALKTAADVDGAQGRIQAQLGLTEAEAAKLSETAQNLWKKGFGEDLSEVGDSLALVSRNMNGITGKPLEEAAQAAYTLQDAFGADITETTKTANQLMKQFGFTSEQAFDLITKGYQEGLDYAGDYLDTLNEYAVYFKTLGFSGEQFFNTLAEGAEKGAFNLDKVGDAVKEFNIRAKDGSDASIEAFKELGFNAEEMTKTFAKGGPEAQEAFTKVVQTLAQVDDEVKRNAIGVALFGTQYEDMEKDVIAALGSVQDHMGNVEGATKRAGEAMQESFGERLQQTWRKFQTSLQPLGEMLLTMAEQWLPKISAAIQFVSKTFENMSPSMQKAVVVFGLVAAAIGPVIAVVGTLVSSFGAISAAFGAASGAIAAAGGAMAILTGPVGWVIAAITAMVAIGVALYKNWDEIGEKSKLLQGALTMLTGPVGLVVAGIKAFQNAASDAIGEVDLFGNEVSESTQKAVGGFLDLNDKATLALNQLSWSGQTVTSEMATSIATTFNQMGEQILVGMKEDHQEQLTTMQTFFNNSKALTETEEKEIVAKMQKGQQEQAQAVQDGQKRISEILNIAKEEKRSITDAERQEINTIQQQMVNTGIVTLTENEREQKVIFERLKQEASTITALQAAEVVKNSKDQKDKVVKEANDQYSKTVAEIIKQRDEMGTISAEQAQKLIDEAKRQKDETVKTATDMHTKVVSEAKTQAKEHVNEVNWETGQVLSKWEVFKNDLSTKWTNIKADTSRKLSEMKTEISNKFNEAKTDATNKITELKTGVTTKAGEMVTGISTKMSTLKSTITKPFTDAWETIKSIPGKIKSAFENLSIKIPKPKLPDIDVSWKKYGGGLLPEVKIPNFSVNWHKVGGVFTKPVVMGNAGFGDVEEAIVPFEGPHASRIAGLIAKEMDKLVSRTEVGNGTVTIEMPVYLDGREIAMHTKDIQSSIMQGRMLFNGVRG